MKEKTEAKAAEKRTREQSPMKQNKRAAASNEPLMTEKDLEDLVANAALEDKNDEQMVQAPQDAPVEEAEEAEAEAEEVELEMDEDEEDEEF